MKNNTFKRIALDNIYGLISQLKAAELMDLSDKATRGIIYKVIREGNNGTPSSIKDIDPQIISAEIARLDPRNRISTDSPKFHYENERFIR